jgi:pimeloyl-ACP methyl ester carboxylesterase
VAPTDAPTAQLTPHTARRVSCSGLAALRADPDPPPGTAPGAAAATHPTVLMLPGYTGSKEDFAPLIDPLATAGFTVLAVDLPGQHESPGPEEEHAYLPAALGPRVAGLVDELAGTGPVVLLGHSYGGLVARAAVLAGAHVSGLVLLDSGPAALPAGERRMVLDIAEPILREHGLTVLEEMRSVREAAHPAFAQRSPELQDLLRRRFLAHHPAGLLGMSTGLRHEPDLVDRLRETLAARHIPALVSCGADDNAWPVDAQREMAARLHADFAVIPGSAHSPNTENPDALLAVLVPTLRAWLSADG